MMKTVAEVRMMMKTIESLEMPPFHCVGCPHYGKFYKFCDRLRVATEGVRPEACPLGQKKRLYLRIEEKDE